MGIEWNLQAATVTSSSNSGASAFGDWVLTTSLTPSCLIKRAAFTIASLRPSDFSPFIYLCASSKHKTFPILVGKVRNCSVRTWNKPFASSFDRRGSVKSAIIKWYPPSFEHDIKSKLSPTNAVFFSDSATIDSSNAIRWSSGPFWPLALHTLRTWSRKAENSGTTAKMFWWDNHSYV